MAHTTTNNLKHHNLNICHLCKRSEWCLLVCLEKTGNTIPNPRSVNCTVTDVLNAKCHVELDELYKNMSQ